MPLWLFVGIGGALGTLLRYTVALTVPHYIAIFAVNVVGCLAIGWLSRTPWKTAQRYALLATGLCGGLTTMSTFAQDANTLATQSSLLYVAATISCCLAAVVIGRKVGGHL